MTFKEVMQNKENQRKAKIGAFVFFTMLVALLLLPMFWKLNPPPEAEGTLVNLGIPDVGQGDENAPEPQAIEETTPPQEEEEVEEVEEVVEPVEEVVEEVTEPEPATKPEVVKTEDPAAIKLRKQKEKEKREKDAADAKKKAQDAKEAKERAEKAAKKKAADEAAKKAAEEAKRLKDAKDKFSGAFGGGGGKGKGNTGKPGNQGDPNGDPNADKLTGVSTGSGKVGGGLGSRGILSSPKVRDNSQATGTVVVKICVNSTGRITSAEYTQSGSTTTNSQLKAIAIANAKKWKFNKGSMDKQCGTLTYVFKSK